jgi:hypothetical protein
LEEVNVFEVIRESFKKSKSKTNKKLLDMTAVELKELREVEKLSN